MSNVELIKKIIEENNGILLSRELRKKNIHLQYINQLEKSGYIEKVARGIYVKKERNVNEFFVIGERYKKGIFSYNTALYFHNLTDRTPLKFDLTFPRNITVHDELINVHYIENKYYMIGIEIKELQDGTKIRIYNKERTICDIIKSRNKMDPQILNMAVKEYFSQKDSNYILLMKYAKIFRIEKIIRYYSEVL